MADAKPAISAGQRESSQKKSQSARSSSEKRTHNDEYSDAIAEIAAAASPDASSSSSVVIDKFRIDPSRLLGEGSYASVCFATNVDTSKLYACKIINDKKDMGNFIERFLPRELKLMRKLNSDKVTCVYGIYKIYHLYYIIMDHCENGDLLRYLQRIGQPLQEEEVRDKSLQILLGVKYLHDDMNIAHRDLKCENILIDGNNKLKLGDFGFARSCTPMVEATETDQLETRVIKDFMNSDVASLPVYRIAQSSKKTSERQAIASEIAKLDKMPASGSGNRFLHNRSTIANGKPTSVSDQPVASTTFCGSVAYAAPEVLSRKTYDPKRYDMWSTGVIVFIMACFFMPFDDSDQPKMVRRQLAKKWRYPPEAKISDLLKEFLEGMMEPNPKERMTVGEAVRHKWLKRIYRDYLNQEQKKES